MPSIVGQVNGIGTHQMILRRFPKLEILTLGTQTSGVTFESIGPLIRHLRPRRRLNSKFVVVEEECQIPENLKDLVNGVPTVLVSTSESSLGIFYEYANPNSKVAFACYD